MRFKVGDICRWVNDGGDRFKTRIRIDKIENDRVYYTYIEDSSLGLLGNSIIRDLKDFNVIIVRTRVANTELSRFMYPDAQVEGDYLLVEVEYDS